MGFFSRHLIPRSARRAAHPFRALKRKATPRSVKKVLRAKSIVSNPVRSAAYAVERNIFGFRKKSKRRPAAKKKTTLTPKVYRHGSCTVNHRTPEAAAKCQRTY